MEKTRKLYPRKCDKCGCGMESGFISFDGTTCSKKCLLQYMRENIETKDTYTMTDWNKDCMDYPDDCYWTEWDELEEDENYTKQGKSVITKPLKTFLITTYVSSGELQISDDEWVDYDCDETIISKVNAETEKEALELARKSLIKQDFDPKSEEFFPSLEAYEVADKGQEKIYSELIEKEIDNNKEEVENFSYPENKTDKSESNYDFIMDCDFECEDFNIGYEQGYIRGLKKALNLIQT